MQGSRDQESSPLIATVQDIQKRLIRPSSLHSPPISSPYSLSLSLSLSHNCLINFLEFQLILLVQFNSYRCFNQQEEEEEAAAWGLLGSGSSLCDLLQDRSRKEAEGSTTSRDEEEIGRGQGFWVACWWIECLRGWCQQERPSRGSQQRFSRFYWRRKWRVLHSVSAFWAICVEASQGTRSTIMVAHVE